jgi:hypothetical protein
LTPSPVATHPAGGTANAAPERRASPLDSALAGLAEELAAARREIVTLARDNANLRARLAARARAQRSARE